jgi:hypothetical protein
MRVLRRNEPASATAGSNPTHPTRSPVERGSAGLAALFNEIPADGSHAILDLGASEGPSLAVYGRYARWIRFADLLTPASSTAPAEAVEDLPANPRRPYDLILGWDIVERLPPAVRPRLMARLAEIAAPGARLFIVLESPDDHSNHLRRFAVLSSEHLRIESSEELRPPHPAIAPAEVKDVLAPFHLRHAFTTRVGLREYIAILPR